MQETRVQTLGQETRVQTLGQEDPLEQEMATHSSILAWRIQGQRSLAGYSSWDSREWTELTGSLSRIEAAGDGAVCGSLGSQNPGI